MITESAITTGIRRYLRQVGAWECKQLGGLGTRAGVPDLLVCVAGRFVGIEVKRPGNCPTPVQEAELAAIRAAGGVGVVAHSLDDVIRVVEPLLVEASAPWQASLLSGRDS